MGTAVLDRPVATPVEARPADETVSRRTRPSEAIRQGAQYHPQGRGHFYGPYTRTTCALGALATGLLGPMLFETNPWLWGFALIVYERTGVRLDDYVPGLERDPALRPLATRTGMGQCSLMQAIAYLNDGACWSREHIADWLESLGY